ncbi:MAG: dipeptidase [Trueperaceae bacterium]|nr:dipeptidase [Trueperaceae bacterium]MCC6310091.1 dipeptidase [Trueperaceae bacterium]MCO5173923.1 dipeptidase [Trueperaceae bacterium]MCW5819587.1 dipeptidase [Trueperaceae bacterium]
MIPVFDGHNDTLLNHIEDPKRDFFSRQADGHVDYVRAREGGMVGGFFAIWAHSAPLPHVAEESLTDAPPKSAPAGAVDPAGARAHADRCVAQLLAWDRDPRFRLVKTAAELERAIDDGVLAGIMHFEGAEAIGPDLCALDTYHAAGLRSLGPVWSRPNLFGFGVPFEFPHSPDMGPGLTPHGLALVRRCNELGIMLDLSHITEKGFWDVAHTSDAPLVATHSNAYAVCPSPRNLTDEQLAAVRASNGVVGLNYNTGFLSPDGSYATSMPLAVMVRHVDHLVDKLGIDGVALGSDFDGATMPDGVKDAAHLPNLMSALADAGYDDEALHKIGYRNWLRVLRLTWGE